MNLNASSFDVLTFDCYGTIIDWETGLLRTLKPILEAHSVRIGDEALLAKYGQFEANLQAGAYRRYADILACALVAFGREHGFEPSAGELLEFSRSVQYWPPFADSAAALRALQKKFRLVVLSNIDDDLFEFTRAQLQGVRFDRVFTAQQIGSYKPSVRNFHYMLERVGVPRERVLHVAQSLFHDIAPTRALGIRNVWVNRRKDKAGSGATLASETMPDHEVPDLRGLAQAFGLA
jgi:2-haloacid dehalogenase